MLGPNQSIWEGDAPEPSRDTQWNGCWAVGHGGGGGLCFLWGARGGFSEEGHLSLKEE